MRVIVAGKGGVGKTSIAAGVSLLLSEMGFNVIALDTDSIPNLAFSLGLSADEASSITSLVENKKLVEERTGAKPGEGWGLLFSLTPKVDDILDNYSVRIKENLRLVVVGGISQGGEGCLCPAIALAKAFLVHVLSKLSRNYIIVDSEAGAEVFGRGLAECFDLMIAICEPSIKSMIISKKLIGMACDIGVKRFVVVVNKVENELQARTMYRRVFSDELYPMFTVPRDRELEENERKGLGVAALPRNSAFFSALKPLVQWIVRRERA